MRGVIQSALGNNRYSVRIVFDQRSADALIAGLQRRAEQLEAEKVELQQRVETERAEYAAAESARESLLQEYRDCVQAAGGGEEAQLIASLRCQKQYEGQIRLAQREVDRMAADVDRWEAEIKRVDLQLLANDRRRGEIERLGELQDFVTIEDAHCRPEDEQLENGDAVVIVRIPGPDNRLVLLKPDEEPEALCTEVVDSRTLDARVLVVDAAIEPGIHAHRPRYRAAEILEIKEDADTCTVRLLPADAQTRLGVWHMADIPRRASMNPASAIEGEEFTAYEVPFAWEGAGCYEVGDTVLLRFLERTWASIEVYGWVGAARCCVGLKLEHGYRTLGVQTDPVVYTAGFLPAYYAGAGTSIPNSDRTEHIVGTVVAGPAWPDGVPVTDASGAHQSVVCPSKSCAPQEPLAHVHTGLMRAVVQAKHGAAKAVIGDVVPVGWVSASPAVQRAPDGRYWVFAAGTDLVARRLEWSEELDVVAGCWCEDGLLTGQDRQLADAYVMASLQTPTEVDEVPLGSLASAYQLGSSSSGSGIAGRRWAWRHQARGATDEHTAGAVIVPLATNSETGNDWRLLSKRCVLTIEWDDDNRPSGFTLDSSSVSEWVPHSSTRFILASGASACLSGYERPFGHTEHSETDAPLSAWYSPNGSIIDCSVRSFGGPSTYTSGTPINDWQDFVCPGEAASNHYTEANNAAREIVTVGGAETGDRASGGFFDYFVTFTLRMPTWESDDVYGLPAGTYGSCTTLTVPSPPAGEQNAQVYQSSYGRMERDVESLSTTIVGSGRYVVFGDDPEAAWLLESYDVQQNNYVGSSALLGGPRGHIRARWYPSMTPIGEATSGYNVPIIWGVLSSEPKQSPIDDLYPPTKVWYVGADGGATAFEEDAALAWATALGALGVSLPCTDQIAAVSIRSSAGLTLATGHQKPSGLADEAVTRSCEWVGGV